MIVQQIDCRSEKHIQTLHPKVQPVFRDFTCTLKEYFNQKGLEAIIICGTRTYKEQDDLYAKGRTAPGPKVTNARGGYSNHNFGIAVDIGLFKNNCYLGNSPYYKEIGPIVAKYRELEWGGNWTSFKDEPHVQYIVPYTIAELRAWFAINQLFA